MDDDREGRQRRAHGKKGACVTGREGGVTGWRSFAGFASALSVTSAPTRARREKKKEKTSLVLDRDVSPNATRYRPDRVVLGGNARVAAHLGSGAPAAAGPGSGARAREIAAPAEEAGARAVSAPGGGEGGGGRRRADRAVLGSREETSRAYHGVSSHDVHRLVHEHLRGHERGDGDGADHRPASFEVHLAQDRGVHGHRVRCEKATTRERVLATRAVD